MTELAHNFEFTCATTRGRDILDLDPEFLLAELLLTPVKAKACVPSLQYLDHSEDIKFDLESGKVQTSTPRTSIGDSGFSSSDMGLKDSSISAFSDCDTPDFKRSFISTILEDKSEYGCPDLAAIEIVCFGPLDQAIAQCSLLKTSQMVKRFSNKMTLLMYAVERDSAELIHAIIRRFELSDLNLQDNDGLTALHYCIRSKATKSASALIYAGANLEVKDFLGRTPLQMAILESNNAISSLLLQNGAALDDKVLEGFREPGFEYTKCDTLAFLDSKPPCFEYQEYISIPILVKRRSQKEFLQSRSNFRIQLLRCPPSVDDFEVLGAVCTPTTLRTLLRVQETASGQLYTVKEYMKRQFLSKHEPEQAFLERSLLANFNHPYIAKLEASFQSEKRLHLVLKTDAVNSLKGLLDSVGSLSISQARVLAADLALAIGAIHSQGLVCGRLTVEDILIDSEGHPQMTNFLHATSAKQQKGLETDSKCQKRAELDLQAGDWLIYGNLLKNCIRDLNSPSNLIGSNISNQSVATEVTEIGSAKLEDFIVALTESDATRRLGSANGYSDVLKHDFFRGLDFKNIANRKHSLFDDSVLLEPIETTKRSLLASGDSQKVGTQDFSGWAFRQIG